MNNKLTPLGSFLMNTGTILFIIGVICGFIGYSDLAWTLGGIGVILIIFMSIFN